MEVMQNSKVSKIHTKTEGQRVNYLANLGGLVAIAELDHLEPDLLLGAFCEIARKLPLLSLQKVATLKQLGAAKLTARGTIKRSFKSWQRAQNTERFDLTQDEMLGLINLINQLKSKSTATSTPTPIQDIPHTLRQLLKDLTHAK